MLAGSIFSRSSLAGSSETENVSTHTQETGQSSGDALRKNPRCVIKSTDIQLKLDWRTRVDALIVNTGELDAVATLVHSDETGEILAANTVLVPQSSATRRIQVDLPSPPGASNDDEEREVTVRFSIRVIGANPGPDGFRSGQIPFANVQALFGVSPSLTCGVESSLALREDSYCHWLAWDGVPGGSLVWEPCDVASRLRSRMAFMRSLRASTKR